MWYKRIASFKTWYSSNDISCNGILSKYIFEESITPEEKSKYSVCDIYSISRWTVYWSITKLTALAQNNIQCAPVGVFRTLSTFKMERFVKIVKSEKLVTIFAKHSFLDVWQDSEYASGQFLSNGTYLAFVNFPFFFSYESIICCWGLKFSFLSFLELHHTSTQPQENYFMQLAELKI